MNTLLSLNGVNNNCDLKRILIDFDEEKLI